ncbi:hypothetical protein DPX16_5764 [Anabarilius grahami]|uniref:Integrase zinc-binding domain-containing protein n=1 Tax=Anabarilius grahami TaxID=495550 RepID=A0A3N0ZAH9_ANAGA|nr:hypothetical protein DPX16_5764 [Anabarilius grahami]
MQQDVAEYARGCQVCCQFQFANTNHRTPLQHRGVTFPWSVNQKDWKVELPLMLMASTDTMQESTRVSPTELMTARQVTLPLYLYQSGDSSLITAYSTHQRRDKLRPQLKKQLATQSLTLQTICKSWKGIVVVLCTHSFLLIQTVNSMKQLFTVFQNDFAQNQLGLALMTDLPPTKTVPAHLADSLCAAILLHVDPEHNEVAVLLNLPISEPDNIYRPKDKLYLAPHLSRCILTKDIHHLGSNKPFLRNHIEGICRSQPMISDTRCTAEAKPRTPVIGTQAEIVGDRLLIHTPTRIDTLTYNQHNTATHVSLPNPSMWIQVPLGSILHLNNLVAYCLSSEEYQSELEIPSSSRNHNHTLDPGQELRMEKGGSQLIDIIPVDTALQALSRLPVVTSSPIAQAWTAANTALCLSMAIRYALTLGLAFILSKGIKGMQESMEERKCQVREYAQPHRDGQRTHRNHLLLDHPDPCAIRLCNRPTRSTQGHRWPKGGL